MRNTGWTAQSSCLSSSTIRWIRTITHSPLHFLSQGQRTCIHSEMSCCSAVLVERSYALKLCSDGNRRPRGLPLIKYKEGAAPATLFEERARGGV